MHLGKYSKSSYVFFVLIVTPVLAGNFIVHQNELTVKVGRTVYLNRDDLVFRKTRARRGDEGCRVEVVQNDPITQRVGKLEPTVFDCSFRPQTVRYIHSGNPFLFEDSVKLRVHRFSARKTVSNLHYLHIKIVNASTDIVVTRGLRHVVVPEFNGISNPIDASVIRFHHSRSPKVTCTVSFNKHESHWPLVGHIIAGNKYNPVEGLIKPCQEFLYMDLRYEHLQKPTPEVDYLPLSVELHDPERSDDVITERFFLPLYIKGALLNSPPRSSFMSMYMMDVDQFVLSTIIPGIISAEDYETPNSQLVYKISKPPGPGQGYIVSLDDRTTPITSFLQDDLENHRIGYQPPNISFHERKIYEVEFKVYDSHFAESMPIVLHVAVRTSSTNSPRVSLNTGLVLLEGQSRTISTDNLQIVDKDNLEDVRIYVTEGPLYGQLLLDSRPAVFFTVADLVSKNLEYVHDDSETTRDRVGLRVNDGSSTVVVNFPIDIISKDDSAPYLVNNVALELNEGETQRIDTSKLLVADIDSVDANTVYKIIQPTEAGEIIRRIRPSDTGTRINKFTQRELIKGQIYYRHFGREEFQDEFIFTLQDQQEPPNESALETFYIDINPVNENPPQLSPDATRLMHVYETDIALITKTELEYTDTETEADKLTYTITSPPYFVYENGRRTDESAGKLIATHNLTMVVKDNSIPAITTFHQDDINHLKISYMPPITDIGPESKLVRFVYSVQDSSGNKVLGQQFDIDVQPVNDKAPEFVTSKLLVEEGGVLGISTTQLSATDIDTNDGDLAFVLEEEPGHGRLQKGGVNLKEKDTFNLVDLMKKDLRYIHDGSEVLLDMFTITLTDGDNRVSKVEEIEIVPVDDEAPRVRGNLRPNLIVSEGSEAVITSNVLAATDDDTEDGTLVFLIVKQPKYGIMQVNSEPTTKFTQQNVKDGIVKYIHSSGEIGSHSVKDSLTLIVSDQKFMAAADLPVYHLNITITPVDNQKPTIIARNPIVVEEGMIFRFTPDFITVKDPDTEPEYIQFVITKQPHWGYLENTKPDPGSEKSNAGNPVTSFKLQDIIDESVNYIQATHKGVEPTEDTFDFYATDGKLQSPEQTAVITIEPMNDEEPDVMLNDIHVAEGGSIIIDSSMLDAVDMDKPKESMKLSISQPPEHGDIVMMLHTKNGDAEAAIRDFTADELHNGMKLKYRHDNSEKHTDKFALTVSDGKHEVKKVCNISIEPVNDGRPEVIKNAGLQLEYGDHAMLSSVVLQSTDIDNTADELYYILVAIPEKGILQYCLVPHASLFSNDCSEYRAGTNFTQADIDSNNVRYIHTTRMSGSELDRFRFVLTDGKNKRPAETFEIRIMNSKRMSIALMNKGIDIQEGQRAIISTLNLSASDESTRPEEIVFAVIRPPRLGQLEYIDRPLVSISSFTQLDLVSQYVVYNHLTKTDFIEDSFTFTVTNGLSEAKDGEFIIRIEPLDKVLPTLVENNLIEVLQGAEIAITPLHLSADDPDTASNNVTFRIKKQPTYGRLYNRGVYITGLFTQNSIDRGFVTYESDGAHTGLDNFLFTVSDGRHDGFLINDTLQLQPAMCSIFIKPLVNDAPKLLTIEHPETLDEFDKGRYGFQLNSRVLKAIDSDTTNTQLVYVIEQRPKHGHLENSIAKRFVRRKFTQRDLDENSLQYIIDLKDRETNDSFTFRIEDQRGNSLKNQVMEFVWSLIEFEKDELVVCENIGRLPLTLTRDGDLSKSSFVSIVARDRTARIGDDYVPNTAHQVQFDAGMSTATWDLRIIDDGLQEETESIMVSISHPVNAVLGRKRKIKIRLINAVNGECPQYLGIISKHQPRVPDTVYLPDNSVGREPETILTGHTFNSVDRHHNPFDNTYNTDPAEDATIGDQLTRTETVLEEATRQAKLDPAFTSLTPDGETKTRKRKRKKNRKRKKGRKRSRKRKKSRHIQVDDVQEGGRTILTHGSDNPENQPPGPGQSLQTVDIKAPQECTSKQGGLLYFDAGTQQMYRCNGAAWQTWRAASNQDQQPETRECQPGWSKFEDRCFKFINERLTWEVAETICQMSHGAHLASVTSRKHLAWLSHLSGKKAYWIGLNDRDQTGVWKYTNGEALTYAKWEKGGPRVKRALHRKICVIVSKRSQYRNKICNKRKSRLICELNIGAELDRSPPKRDVASFRHRTSRKKCRSKDCRDQLSRSQQNGGRSKSSQNNEFTKGFFFGN